MKFSTERPYLWLFATLAILGFIADQASKYVVFAKLDPSTPIYEVIPNYFDLRTNYTAEPFSSDSPLHFLRTISSDRVPHVNQGALFGLGAGWNTLFTIISLAAAVFIIFWSSRPNVARDRFLCIALGLILAGTLGNLYDRLVFGGVRDFLHCYYETHIWPDFNVADCCLVVGALSLLTHSFFVKDPSAEPAKTESAPATMQTTSPSNGM